MRKTKQRITQVAKMFADELRSAYPGVETEVIDEKIGGSDVWVRVELPPDLIDKKMEISSKAAGLDNQYYVDTGVSIVTTVVQKQPAGSAP